MVSDLPETHRLVNSSERPANLFRPVSVLAFESKMNKTRSSTKIALAFVAVAAVAYFGYGLVSGWMVNRKVFTPIKPGNVNIVGVDTGAGYYIVVANQIAQLVRGQTGEFQPGSHEEIDSEKK